MLIRRRRIDRTVRELLERHGITQAPVDVAGIAKSEGIQILEGDLDDGIAGFLHRQGDAAAIGLNAKNSRVRQRFTIGHELGHFFLHDVQTWYVDQTTSAVRLRPQSTVQYRKSQPVPETIDTPRTVSDVDEREANIFAAELLMPRDFLAKDLDELQVDDVEELVKKLAARYMVSREAMLYQLVDLGYVEK